MQDNDIKSNSINADTSAISDRSAWDSLVESYSCLVYRIIKQKAAQNFFYLNSHDVEEIFQQTFSNIWCRNSISKIMNAKSVPAYITVIAQNTVIDFLRNNIRIKQIKEKAGSNCNIHSERDNPREHAQCEQLQESIKEFIDRLTVKEKRIITLELLYDLKHREISDIMEIPINTVSTIVSKLKQALKQMLKEKGYGA